MNDGVIEWPGFSDEDSIEELSPLKYDASADEWREHPPGALSTDSHSIRIITHNTWFQEHRRDIRQPALLDIFHESSTVDSENRLHFALKGKANSWNNHHRG
ncbi:MAG: hypothetical protein EP297_14530 [Gammaproteobacteria bacterium]|nr:MAG: hypothetical protein EP297_14530 [Gammaproteobacteria bacterium]